MISTYKYKQQFARHRGQGDLTAPMNQSSCLLRNTLKTHIDTVKRMAFSTTKWMFGRNGTSAAQREKRTEWHRY